MDHHRSSYSPFHHRQSLRPTVGSTMASRYGLGTSSSSTSPSRRTSAATGIGGNSTGSSASSAASSAAAAAMNTGVGITSGVVSFMKKFVSKASGSTNSIDSSFQKYHQQMQKEQQKQKQQQQQAQTTKSFFSSFRDTTTTSTTTPGPSSTLAGATSAASTASTTSGATTALHYSDTGYSSNANSPATTPTISPIPNAITACSPTLSLGSLGGANIVANESRPMSAVSMGNSTRGPLFNKIRAKVASTFQGSSSSVVNSTSPEPVQSSTGMMGSSMITTSTVTTAISLPAPSNTAPVFATSTISSVILETQKDARRPSVSTDRRASASGLSNTQEAVPPYYFTSQSHPPMLSMIGSQSSSLTNEQLTAHLTEEERQILQKVFQKEEEFRELALKNLAGTPGFDNVNGGSGRGSISGISGAGGGSPSSTSVATAGISGIGPILLPSSQPQGVSHLSTNLLDPVAAAVHRRRSSAAMSADATGLCRICRKVIMKDESGAHRCSNCHELVCDDCSSYSSREESKYWMCSFCRRRGSSLVITTAGMNTTSSTLTTSTSFKVSASPTTSTGGDTLQVATPTKRKSSFSEFTRVVATEKIEQPRQNSLDLQRSFPLVRKLSSHQVQPTVSPAQQPQQHQQQLPQPIILIKDMTNEISSQPTSSLLTSCIETKEVNSKVLSPGGNARPRIYSLSDDEELLSDDDNDEDDEELGDEDEEIDVEDEDEEEDEEDEEMLQLYNIEKSKDIIGTFKSSLTTSASVGKRGASNKKTKKTNKNKNNKLKSLVGSPNEPAEDEYIVGGQSHGTLASMPAECLKRRRSSKRKKKKKAAAAAQNTSFNSDDELFTSKPNEEPSGSMLSSGTPEIVFETISPQSRLVTAQAQRKLSTTSQQFYNNNNDNQVQHIAGTSFGSGTSSVTLDETTKLKDNSFPVGSFIPLSSGGSKMMGAKPISSKWWLLSKKVSMLSRYQAQHPSTSSGSPTPQIITGGQYFQFRKSSESSDISDPFRYSPPQDSLTPSSEYSRSPRESADSDMLGLTYSSLAMQQRRSIPSVLIDGSSMLNNVGGGAYLTLKDCYIRRGSTGRALPNIPVEPSR